MAFDNTPPPQGRRPSRTDMVAQKKAEFVQRGAPVGVATAHAGNNVARVLKGAPAAKSPIAAAPSPITKPFPAKVLASAAKPVRPFPQAKPFTKEKMK